MRHQQVCTCLFERFHCSTKGGFFSSFHELIQSRGDRRLSVCPSVCKLLRKSLLLACKWPDRHQTCTWWTPGQRASRMCSRSRSRSKVTWYGHFCAGTKIASSRGQKAGSPPNLHTMITVIDNSNSCPMKDLNHRLYFEKTLSQNITVHRIEKAHFWDIYKVIITSALER